MSARRARLETERQARLLRLAFAVLVFLVAAPLFTVPGTGLSFSALAFAPVVAMRFREGLPMRDQGSSLWFGLFAAFLLAMSLSAVTNAWTNDQAGPLAVQLRLVMQYAYWILLFDTTRHLVSSRRMGPVVVRWGGIGAVLAAVFALLEWYVLDSMTSAGVSRLTRMSVNLYGIQFSTFAPLLMDGAARETLRMRIVRLGLFAATLGVALVNGSRSSWIALVASIAVLGAMKGIARRSVKAVLLPVGIATVVFGLWLVSPSSMTARVTDRASTLERLDTDKSFQVRQLMVQKALAIFWQQPLLGSGPNSFRSQDVDLAIQGPLMYGTMAHFNEKSAHNAYVLLLAEGGLLSTLPIAILILVLATGGARATIRAARQGVTWPCAVYASFVGMSIHLWTLAGMGSSGTFLVYGTLAGIIELSRRATPRWTRQP